MFLLLLLALLPLLTTPLPQTTLTPSQISSFIPPHLRPSPITPNTTDHSTCTRSYWKGTWTFSITIHNKTTPERSTLGMGLWDNVNADCTGLTWPQNPTPLAQVGGRVTDYYVWIEVSGGEAYGGCVEKAIRQAEDKSLVCEVVPSPCQPSASECSN